MARKKKETKKNKRIIADLRGDVCELWTAYCESIPDISTQQGRIGNLLRIWKNERTQEHNGTN